MILAIAEEGGMEAVAAKVGKPAEGAARLSMRGSVAVLPVRGPIFRYSSLFSAISGASSVQALATDLQRAVEDPSVSAIVLEIDSPGGEVTGVGELAAAVYQARGTKPILAYVGGMGASAAYWLASAADEVIVAPTGMAGSIGVVMVHPGSKSAREVEFVSSQSPHKRPDPHTDAGAALYQSRVDQLAQVFISDVARYRGVSEEAVTGDFGGGAVLIGQAAVDAGLADRLGSFEGLLAELGVRDAAGAPSRIIVSGGSGSPALAEPRTTQGKEEGTMPEERKPSRWERFKALFDGGDDDEPQALVSGQPLQTAILGFSNPELERLRNENEELKKRATADAEKQIKAQAQAFFAAELQGCRALPCQQAAAESLFAQLAADDLANPVKVLVGDREVSRVEAFQAFAADGPTHDLTAELLPAAGGKHLPAGALALPNREETPDPRRPKEPDAKRLEELLAMEPIGQAILRERNGRAK